MRLISGCLMTRYVSFCKISGGADCPTSETTWIKPNFRIIILGKIKHDWM